jgi:hypothetical protein
MTPGYDQVTRQNNTCNESLQITWSERRVIRSNRRSRNLSGADEFRLNQITRYSSFRTLPFNDFLQLLVTCCHLGSVQAALVRDASAADRWWAGNFIQKRRRLISLCCSSRFFVAVTRILSSILYVIINCRSQRILFGQNCGHRSCEDVS